MNKSTKGFSLIELLIVVAIILIIAAIAIPNLLRSRIAANQASAAQSLRTINTSNVAYSSTYGVGFASTLAALGTPLGGCPTASVGQACLIDPALTVATVASSAKSGYYFAYTLTDANDYTVNGNPATAGTTGTNYYFTDQTNVITFDSTAAATNASTPIGN